MAFCVRLHIKEKNAERFRKNGKTFDDLGLHGSLGFRTDRKYCIGSRVGCLGGDTGRTPAARGAYLGAKTFDTSASKRGSPRSGSSIGSTLIKASS